MSARKFVNSITIASSAPAGRVSAISGDYIQVTDLPFTGTASGTTFACGDGTWKTVSSGSTGTVTNVSVVNANGFNGTVANPTTTPAITLTTTVSSGLLKSNGSGGIVAAVAGTDYTNSITLGSTTTGAAGTSASVTNTGTSTAPVLSFTIPKGDTGATGSAGTNGTNGSAATIAVGTVTTGAVGSSVTITNSGSSSAAVFNFSIPVGATGATGSAGSNGVNGSTWYSGTGVPSSGLGVNGDYYLRTGTGDVYLKASGAWGSPIENLTGPTGSTGGAGSPGAAATVSAGTATALASGATPTVSNSGTSSAAVFNFGIPSGATGATGPNAVSTSTTTTLNGLLAGDGAHVGTAGASSVTGSLIASGILRGHLAGFGTQYNATTLLDILQGVCRDDTDTVMIYTTSTISKVLQSGGSWASGTLNNGLDTGAIAASSWYHVYAIAKAAGANSDILFSLSATSPTLPSGYLYKRRIGSIKTNASSQIIQFFQDGDYFSWNTRVLDVSATNPGTSAVTRTLSTPTGVRTRARIVVGFGATNPSADNPAGILITDLSTTDVAPSVGDATLLSYGSPTTYNAANFFAPTEVYTNTSSQVRSRLQISTSGTQLFIITAGWVDRRGRDA